MPLGVFFRIITFPKIRSTCMGRHCVAYDPPVFRCSRARGSTCHRGVEMDVLGLAYNEFTEEQRTLIVSAHPRGENFKEQIIDAFSEGMKHRPDSTFGTVNDDVLALKDPGFRRMNFCSIILGNAWNDSYHACVCNDPAHHHR